MPGPFPCCCVPDSAACGHCSSTAPASIIVAIENLVNVDGLPATLNCDNSDCPSLDGSYQLEQLTACTWQKHFSTSGIYRRHDDDPTTGTDCSEEYDQITMTLMLSDGGTFSQKVRLSILLGQRSAAYPQHSWVHGTDLYEIHVMSKAWDNPFTSTDDCDAWAGTALTEQVSLRVVSVPDSITGYYACDFGAPNVNISAA